MDTGYARWSSIFKTLKPIMNSSVRSNNRTNIVIHIRSSRRNTKIFFLYASTVKELVKIEKYCLICLTWRSVAWVFVCVEIQLRDHHADVQLGDYIRFHFNIHDLSISLTKNQNIHAVRDLCSHHGGSLS